MINIGETIAKLRHERNMTQEALAETLCVSPQTISKWENSVNLPDVQMLPLIADVFGVRIDALFGREDRSAEYSPDRAYEGAAEAVKRVFAGLGKPEWESEESWWATYNRYLREDERTRSAVCQQSGMVYVREAIGALALKRPAEGWHTLFRSESAARAIALLNNPDFRRALCCVLEHGMRDFTLPFLCKRAGIEDAQALESCLKESGVFEFKELTVDDQTMAFCSLVNQNAKLLPLLAALTYCAEFTDWQGVFCLFCDSSTLD
ncbi:MAG: helix-turn-helix transcriptional regulator [Christensenellaceae bacterium]|nr:helix-turn-helix transcriptional regulator [Christensenellaceae bacterium]